MRKQIFISVLFLSMAFFLNSCCSMFRQKELNGTIIVKENANAEIYVENHKIGYGQTDFHLPRNKSFDIEIKEKDCEPKKQTFDVKFRTGNFISRVPLMLVFCFFFDFGGQVWYKPELKGNPSVQKINNKKYIFTFDYPECN